MRFNVPKHIDIEDKIFGPLTFKQFVYLVGGAGLCVIVLWLSPSIIITLPAIGVIVAFSLALAFWNYNGKPFIYTVQAAFLYLTSTRTYVWKRRQHKEKNEEQLKKELAQIEQIMSDSEGDTITKKSVSVTVGDDDAAQSQQQTPPEPTQTDLS